MIVYCTFVFLAMLFIKVYVSQRHQTEVSSMATSRYIKQRKQSEQPSILFLLLSMLSLVLVYGLRYRVGTDYMYYYESFERVVQGTGSYFNEPLYNLLQYMVSFISSNYILFSTICGFLLCIPFYVVILKVSKNPTFSILLFVITNTYFIAMNGVRQGLAMAFLMVSIYYLIKNQEKYFYVYVMVAAMFHVSALIFLPVYRLTRVTITPLKGWMMIAIFAGIGFAGKGMLESLISLTQYAHYIASDFNEMSFEIVLFIINIIIFSVLCFYYHKAIKTDTKREFMVLFWLQLLAVCFLMFSSSLPLAKRFTWMFSLNQILVLPMLVYYEDSKIGKLLVKAGIIICFTLSIYVGDYQNGAHNVFPYQTFMSEI